MDYVSVGVVLRKKSSHYKVALLDKKYGRIEARAVQSLGIGSLVSYTLHEKWGNFSLKNGSLLYVPLSFGKSDLLFLHHVLEIIYYFAPIGSCVKGVFDLLAFLYRTEHMVMSIQYKKFFLLKLLMVLGVTSELSSTTDMLNTMNMVTVEQFASIVMTREMEKKLDKWLWLCVWQHPYVNEFKTVHFLEKNRAI